VLQGDATCLRFIDAISQFKKFIIDAMNSKTIAKKVATVAIDESGIDGKPVRVGNATSKSVCSTLRIFRRRRFAAVDESVEKKVKKNSRMTRICFNGRNHKCHASEITA
jgi:hypothetical protein